MLKVMESILVPPVDPSKAFDVRQGVGDLSRLVSRFRRSAASKSAAVESAAVESAAVGSAAVESAAVESAASGSERERDPNRVNRVNRWPGRGGITAAAEGGHSFALVGAVPGPSMNDTRLQLMVDMFDGACRRGVNALCIHATVESYLTFPTGFVERTCVLQHMFGVGVPSLDALGPRSAARVIRARLNSKVDWSTLGLVMIENVFSVSRSALARCCALVAHLVNRPTVAWGGLQVIASGCPIQSSLPIQYSAKPAEYAFLAECHEWCAWFAQTYVVPTEGEVNPRLCRILTSSNGKTRAERSAHAACVHVCASSGQGVCTVYAFAKSARAKMAQRAGPRVAVGVRLLVRGETDMSYLTHGDVYERERVREREREWVDSRSHSHSHSRSHSRSHSQARSDVPVDCCEGLLRQLCREDDVPLRLSVVRALTELGVDGECQMFTEGDAVMWVCGPRRGEVGVVVDGSGNRVSVSCGGSEVVSVDRTIRHVDVMSSCGITLEVDSVPLLNVTHTTSRLASMFRVHPSLRVHIDPFGFERSHVSALALECRFCDRLSYSSVPDPDKVYMLSDDLGKSCAYFEIHTSPSSHLT
jgi:hypothetical protein